MITKTYIETMARYNCWQNQSIFREADMLDDGERRKDRGAFFGSIHRTLSHLMWGDTMWMHRFSGSDLPAITDITKSGELIEDWQELKLQRSQMDERILKWADAVDENIGERDLSWYSGLLQKDLTKPYGLLITHFFNHQTHHRGQVHAMITAAGGKPDDTDLGFMPDNIEFRQL